MSEEEIVDFEEIDPRASFSLTGFTDEALTKLKAEVRRDALLEAAKAICSFCRDGSWSTTIDDMGAYGYEYTHLKFGESHQPRCAASGIRKLLAAEQGQGQGQGKE